MSNEMFHLKRKYNFNKEEMHLFQVLSKMLTIPYSKKS